jgi:hypothetical protein
MTFVAVALHLLSGLAIVAHNKRRVLAHPPTTGAMALKTSLTAAAPEAGVVAVDHSGSHRLAAGARRAAR